MEFTALYKVVHHYNESYNVYGIAQHCKELNRILWNFTAYYEVVHHCKELYNVVQNCTELYMLVMS